MSPYPITNFKPDLEYVEEEAYLRDLCVGYRGSNCHFDFRSYHDRVPEAQSDYNRLVTSIFHYGIRKPLITFRSEDGHFVLVGQRRWDIGRHFAIYHHLCVKVWRITSEDPGGWTSADLSKLEELKQFCGEVEY